jgi:hypothetical protein
MIVLACYFSGNRNESSARNCQFGAPPQSDIPLALFSFNVGVEVGQLIFIGTVLSVLACVRRLGLPQAVQRHALPAATYAIGTMAAFRFIQRLSVF